MKGMWTRRQFAQGAVALAGAALAASRGAAALVAPQRLAFVGSEDECGSIHVFRIQGERWTLLREVEAAAPAHLLLHPTLPVLYAVHNVDTWDHLPRGAVSAYRVDRHTGDIALLHTQPLSLAATRPRHAVLTAGASHLFVAAEGGGLYNLLPVAADGTLQPASAIRKEFGWEEGGVSKTSAPNSVALLPDGSLLAADAGLETLSNFVVHDGTIVLQHRTRVHRGEGPQHLSVSTDGCFAYTSGAITGRAQRHTLVSGVAVDEVDTAVPPPTALGLARAHARDALSAVVL